MMKKIYEYYQAKPTAYKILLAIFALAFTKSIFIFPFTLISGAAGIILGLLLSAAFFVICVATLYFLSRISWEYRKAPVKRRRILQYMIPSLAMNVFLLAVFFPGKMSWDSMYIWSTVLQGSYSNLHPITYTLFVGLMNSIVNSPWLAISVQFVYASFVYAYVGYVFEGLGLNKKLCWAIVLVLSFYPVNFHQSVTMLKDVPYMMSLVLISAIMLKVLSEDSLKFGKIAALFAASLAAMFSRHNGVPSVLAGLIIFAVYYLVKKKRKDALKMTALLAAVIIAFFGTNKLIETVFKDDYDIRSNVSAMVMMPSAQCSYTILENLDELPEELLVGAKRFFNIGGIKAQKETYPNWEFNNRPNSSLNVSEVENNKVEFLRFYLKMLKAYPKDMLLEYQQMTGIIWAVPNYGYTFYRNVGIAAYNDAFYFEIPFTPVFPKLADFFDREIGVVFWMRPALWLMLSVLMLFASSKRHGMKGLCIITPMIANAVMFFAGTPAQNVRYFYCNFSIFVIIFVFALMNGKKAGKDA